jgi:hypothetical protein
MLNAIGQNNDFFDMMSGYESNGNEASCDKKSKSDLEDLDPDLIDYEPSKEASFDLENLNQGKCIPFFK